MKFNSKTAAATLAAATALTTMTAAARAQFGGQPAPNAGGKPLGGGPMGGAPGPGGSADPFGAPKPGGVGAFGGHSPFASGTVSAVDAAAGTITLEAMGGGTAGQVVKVTDGTQISAQTVVRVEDLKVGDIVQVRGVPTGITALQITASDSEDPIMGGPFGGARPGGGAGAQGMASAQATGRISGVSPLTIAINDTLSVVLKTAPDVRITKMLTEKVGDLKVGDRIMANGQPGDDGTLTATRIHVNLDYGFKRLPGQRPMPQMPMPATPMPGQ